MAFEIVFAAAPMAAPMSGRTTGAHKLNFAAAEHEEDELGVGAEIDDKGEKFQAVGGQLGSASEFSEFSKDFPAALILDSPPASKGNSSTGALPAPSFALLISGIVGALPRLVAAANDGEVGPTDDWTFCQHSSSSSVRSRYRFPF